MKFTEIKMTSFRHGQRVKLYNMRYDYSHMNGLCGTVTDVTYRGPSVCALYEVAFDNGQQWTTCDCHLKPAQAPALDRLGRTKVDWDRVAWRPNLERLPEFISAELSRRRARRWE